MNIFIGLSIPEDSSIRITKTLNAKIDFIKWLQPKNLHVTLKFLGKLDEEKIYNLKEVISQLSFSPIALYFKNIAFWQPTLLVIEIKPSNELLKLKHKIESVLFKHLAIPSEEKEFIPHITIARMIKKKISNSILDDYLSTINLSDLQSTVWTKELALYRSKPVSNSLNDYERLLSLSSS